MTLGGAIAFEPGTVVGRTFADVLADHLGLGVIVSVSAFATVLVFIGGLIVWAQATRAKAEGRSFAAFWGLVSVGEKASPAAPLPAPPILPPVGPTSGSFPSSPPTDGFQRGALAVTRAAHEIAMARPEDVEGREMYLLIALVQATNQQANVMRRASILRARKASNGDCVMQLHRGTPEVLFKNPPTVFSKRAYEEGQGGLCWHAVHACRGGHEKDSIQPFIFYAPDITKEQAFVESRGHHPFRAILIAPIVHERTSEVLGVVCLDSSVPDHYTEVDKHLMAIAALSLAVAWKARGSSR